MDKLKSGSSAMEGHGAYNRHAKLPAGGGELATPFLERAAWRVEFDTSDRPVVVADYGSSQGKNSLAPMRAAISVLRERLGRDRPIVVYHEDRPTNDFNSLFEVLHADPGRYAKGDNRVYPCAIGRSFYENVLPPGSVDLGWCSYAAMWISKIPTLIPEHFYVQRSPPGVRAVFERQAVEDWRSFLSVRSLEMRRGARIVVAMPGADDNGESAFAPLMDDAKEVLAEMERERAISAEERERMVLGAWARRKRDLTEPFAGVDAFQSLIVEECETEALPDAAWVEFERDGDRRALAAKHAAFFRAVFAPSLAAALTRVSSGEAGAFEAFADRLQRGLRERRAANPAPIHSLVQVAVFAKTG
jgi:SAM dependent carboxyl methyltransferase